MIAAHDGLPAQQRECFSVLLELACTLEDWRQDLCLIGGWATYALTELFLAGTAEAPLRHRGSLDVDIAAGLRRMSAEEAEALASKLRAAGYRGPESFHWHRDLPSGSSYRLAMMTLPPARHEGGVVEVGGYEFAPFWHGEGAFVSPMEIRLQGTLPSGEAAAGRLRVASPGGLLVVKAWTVSQLGRAPQSKHVYDLFCLLRTYPDGPERFWRELEPFRGTEDLQVALDVLEVMFEEGAQGAHLVAEERTAEPGRREEYVDEARATVREFLQGRGRE